MREPSRMFDTLAAKFEKGPYVPKDASRNAWETRKHERFDTRLRTRIESVVHILNLDQVRIAIMGDGGMLRFEASLPKLLYGNNLASLVAAERGLPVLREYLLDYVDGELPELGEADYM